MPKDPTVQVALVGIITTLITTAGVVLVALLNNRKERTDAADEGIEGVLRERLVFKDEQLTDEREEKAELERKLEQARADGARKDDVIRWLQSQLATRSFDDQQG